MWSSQECIGGSNQVVIEAFLLSINFSIGETLVIAWPGLPLAARSLVAAKVQEGKELRVYSLCLGAIGSVGCSSVWHSAVEDWLSNHLAST